MLLSTASELCNSPLDGSGQFTVLSLLVALVAYIRNIPVKQLVDSRKELATSAPQALAVRGKRLSFPWIDLQLFVLNLVQLFLVSISLLVAGRSVFWGPAYDGIVFASLFVLASVFFVFHLFVDGGHLIRYLSDRLENLIHRVLGL